MKENHYRHLGVMATLSFVAMYLLMYAMVNSVVAGILMFALIQRQIAVSDRQFLRSMIPHHASAILMCESASLQDPEILALCKGIVSGQQAEIDQMVSKLPSNEMIAPGAVLASSSGPGALLSVSFVTFQQ